MAIQRRSYFDLDAGMPRRGLPNQHRQVSLQMGPQRQKVRHNDNPDGVGGCQTVHRASQIGLSALQESGLHYLPALLCHSRRHSTHGLVRAFDSRPVREDHKSCNAIPHVTISGDAASLGLYSGNMRRRKPKKARQRGRLLLRATAIR